VLLRASVYIFDLGEVKEGEGWLGSRGTITNEARFEFNTSPTTPPQHHNHNYTYTIDTSKRALHSRGHRCWFDASSHVLLLPSPPCHRHHHHRVHRRFQALFSLHVHTAIAQRPEQEAAAAGGGGREGGGD
jgi:hypothetical protein